MRELANDPFYEQIKAYERCIIDYCLIEDDIPHQGYRSHKDAILFALCKVIERYIDYQLKAEIDFNNTRKMRTVTIKDKFGNTKAALDAVNTSSYDTVTLYSQSGIAVYNQSSYNKSYMYRKRCKDI